MQAWILETADVWRGSLIVDLVRYAVFAIGVWLVLWVVLARPLAGRKIRAERPPARQLALEFLVSVRSIAIFSTIGLSMFILERAGLLPGPALASSWGAPWFWTSLVLMVIAHDAYFYWAHRLMHHPRLFRRFHRRHHKSHNPSPFSAYSFDLGEAAVMASFVPLWMLLVPTPWAATGLYMLHQIVRNTLGHSGYELMPARADGRPMFGWLTTTVHHDLHHAQAGWNYGLYFTWWDRWMGTEHPDYHARYAQAVRRPLKPRAAGAEGRATATLVAVACLLALPGATKAEAPQALAGDWATPGLGSVVRLAACPEAPDRLCGRLIWTWDSPKPASLGRVILRDFHWSGQAWSGGEVFNPDDGRTYRGSLWLDGKILRLKGCAGPFCQSQAWRRLADIPRPG
jgi:Delta7-sterol 5-desaturase